MTKTRGTERWLAFVGYAAVLIYVLSPRAGDYSGALVSAVTFPGALALFKHARPLRHPVLCPLNWCYLVFFVQLVVVPLLVCFNGPYEFALPMLPGPASINAALVLASGSFFAFAFAVHLYRGRRTAQDVEAKARRPWPAGHGVALVFAVVGIVGILLSFGDLHGLLAYYAKTGNETQAHTLVESGSLETLLGLILRPFLGFSVIVVWCRWVDRRRSRSRLLGITITAAAGALVLVSYANFSYNRGSFVAPLIALAAVYAARVRRVRIGWLLAAAAIAFVLLAGYRAYRNDDLTLAQVVTQQQGVQAISHATDLNAELQVYGGGPQFTAFLLDQTHFASTLQYGRTLIGSAMYPVPSLGRPFRHSSGVEYYNRLVYGHSRFLDQVIPFQGELLINFHIPGVLLGYLLLGWLIAWMQRRFEAAPSAVQAFAWQYAATWFAFLVAGSVAVVSQILVYFFWPIYVLAFAAALQRGSSAIAARWARTPARRPSVRAARLSGTEPRRALRPLSSRRV